MTIVGDDHGFASRLAENETADQLETEGGVNTVTMDLTENPCVEFANLEIRSRFLYGLREESGVEGEGWGRKGLPPRPRGTRGRRGRGWHGAACAEARGAGRVHVAGIHPSLRCLRTQFRTKGLCHLYQPSTLPQSVPAPF